jgi:hypothetical protein
LSSGLGRHPAWLGQHRTLINLTKERRMTRISVISSCLFSIVWCFAATNRVVADEAATLKVTLTKAPDQVAEPIRAALDAKSYLLSNGDKTFLEFWFRKQLPLAKKPAGGSLDVDTIADGTLLGVVKVDAPRHDFRDEDLPTGVYTMRLGIQPEDGNHQGSAPTRTFALLIPAAKDTKLDAMARKDLLKAAATINAAHHPSNLNLQSIEDSSGELPRLDERNDGQHKVLVLKLPAQVGDAGNETTLTFALVYEGTGQI